MAGLWTRLVDGCELLHLELAALTADEALGFLALGIERARQERSETALAQDHLLVGMLRAHLGSHVLVELRPAFARTLELPRVLALGIVRAGEELSVSAPLDDHGGSALVALLVGLLLHALDVLHLLAGAEEVSFELAPELRERVEVVVGAVLDLVELLLHRGGVLDVHDVVEVVDEQVRHHEAELGGEELALALLDVLPGLDGGDDRRIRGRTSDAVFLELLHEARLGEARGGLGEMLIGVEVLELHDVAHSEGRQLALAGLGLRVVSAHLVGRGLRLALLVRGFLVDGEESLELHGGPLRPEEIGSLRQYRRWFRRRPRA